MSLVPTIQVTFDCAEPELLARFWAQALSYEIPAPPGVLLGPEEDVFVAWREFLAAAGVPESEWSRAAAAQDPEGVGPRLFFQRVPEGKTVKNRLHLDVRAAPGLSGDERMAALEAECIRLVACGATRLARHEPAMPLSGGHIVMADPEGNEFCLD
jgi:hypothetical protein